MPPSLTRISHAVFFMTSHLDSHRTTDIKADMLLGVQTGNGTPHDKYDICGIAPVRTNRKDDIFMQRRLVQDFTYILEWGQGTSSLTKHTWRLTYSALRHIFKDHRLPHHLGQIAALLLKLYLPATRLPISSNLS